jgi:hypothetical protein
LREVEEFTLQNRAWAAGATMVGSCSLSLWRLRWRAMVASLKSKKRLKRRRLRRKSVIGRAR